MVVGLVGVAVVELEDEEWVVEVVEWVVMVGVEHGGVVVGVRMVEEEDDGTVVAVEGERGAVAGVEWAVVEHALEVAEL